MNSKPHPDLLTGRGAFIIDLKKLEQAVQHIRSVIASSVQIGAVVKANAYGHGMTAISTHLYRFGVRQFYVAQLDEGISLRAALPEAQITVFEGLLAGSEATYQAHNLTACLNDLGQFERAESLWRAGGGLRAELQVDTAMSRLGLPVKTAEQLISSGAIAKGFVRILSHLACADEPEHPLNAQQLDRFSKLVAQSGLEGSLAASGGILLGPDYHFSMVRPGLLLSGYRPFDKPDRPKDPILRWYAPILQIRDIAAGESVGYGASYVATAPRRLATLGAGYGDGYPRALQAAGQIEIAGHIVPIAGRISMDVMVVDVSDIPPALLDAASHACLLGPHFDAEDMAAACQTIPYEILTGLGLRQTRLYDGADPSGSI